MNMKGSREGARRPAQYKETKPRCQLTEQALMPGVALRAALNGVIPPSVNVRGDQTNGQAGNRSLRGKILASRPCFQPARGFRFDPHGSFTSLTEEVVRGMKSVV